MRLYNKVFINEFNVYNIRWEKYFIIKDYFIIIFQSEKFNYYR